MIMEQQKTVPEFTASGAEQIMAAVIDQTLRAPWVLVEVERDPEDTEAFGVKLHVGGGIADMQVVMALLRKVLDAAAPETPKVSRIFTFGVGQRHPVTGEPLGDRYVEIIAESIDHCRVVMLNHFGNGWGFDYATVREAGMDRYGLRELPRNEWPPSSDKFYVDASGCSRAR